MSIEQRSEVFACARVLADHNGRDTVVLDMSGLAVWTDYFVVTTATSSMHLGGLVRHLSDHLAARGLQPARWPRPADGEEWCLMDLGWFVVHVLSERARAFYELEKLWFQAEALPVAASSPDATGRSTNPI